MDNVGRSRRSNLTRVNYKAPHANRKERREYAKQADPTLLVSITQQGWTETQADTALRWSNNDMEKAIKMLKEKHPLKSSAEDVDEDESTQDMEIESAEEDVDMEVSNNDPLPLSAAPNDSTHAITISISLIDVTSQHIEYARNIGASIVDSVEDTATAMVVITTIPVKWTLKNMIGNNKGILVSIQWLEQSSKAGRALPIDSFLLGTGGSGDILQRVSVCITSVALKSPLCPPHHDLQFVVTSAGGILLTSVDAPVVDGHTRLVVTSCDTPRFREKKIIEGITSGVPTTIISLDSLMDVFKTQRSPIVLSQDASGSSSEVYSRVAVRADASPPAAEAAMPPSTTTSNVATQPQVGTAAPTAGNRLKSWSKRRRHLSITDDLDDSMDDDIEKVRRYLAMDGIICRDSVEMNRFIAEQLVIYNHAVKPVLMKIRSGVKTMMANTCHDIGSSTICGARPNPSVADTSTSTDTEAMQPVQSTVARKPDVGRPVEILPGGTISGNTIPGAATDGARKVSISPTRNPFAPDSVEPTVARKPDDLNEMGSSMTSYHTVFDTGLSRKPTPEENSVLLRGSRHNQGASKSTSTALAVTSAMSHTQPPTTRRSMITGSSNSIQPPPNKQRSSMDWQPTDRQQQSRAAAASLSSFMRKRSIDDESRSMARGAPAARAANSMTMSHASLASFNEPAYVLSMNPHEEGSRKMPPTPLLSEAAKNPSLLPPPSSKKWPSDDMMNTLKKSLSAEHYTKAEAIFNNTDLTDSTKLLHLSSILPASREGDNIRMHPLMIRLIATHSALYIIIGWVRTSPDEIVIEFVEINSLQRREELSCLSQQKRNLACYNHLEDEMPDNSILLCPVMIIAKGVKGQDTLQSSANGGLKSVVTSLSSACRPEQRVVVTATEQNRLNRIPEEASRMESDLGRLGADTVYWKSFGKSSQALNQAFAEFEADIARIKVWRTPYDCCKGLRPGITDNDRAAQIRVNNAVQGMRNRLELIHTSDPLNAKGAIAKGNELCTELSPLYHKDSTRRKEMEGVLKRVLHNPSCAEEEAEKLYTKAQQVPPSQQVLNLLVARATNEDRDFFELNDQIFALAQLAHAYAYLANMPNINTSGSVNSIISSVHDREDLLIEETMICIEAILQGRVNSVLPTQISRLSGHEGYNLLIDKICDLTGTKLKPTQCIGICNKLAAKNEQKGRDEARVATEKYNAVAHVDSSDLLGTRLRTIANWDLRYQES